jgi:transposase
MNRKFKERFEEGMRRIQSSLTKKHGVKKYDKVVERVGRLKSQYPSVSRYYVIEYERDDKNKDNMSGISWRLAVPDSIDSGIGTYYLRSNVHGLDEQTVWAYYNIIREIECTFRQLKTDLNLRPIYHQTDSNTEAHLFLGLLSYWIVNTIRHKLKAHGDNRYWTEIHRVMSTQKAVTSTAVNALGEEVKMRICTRPTLAAAEIYKRLGYRPTPFRKIEICTSQMHKRQNPKNYASDS